MQRRHRFLPGFTARWRSPAAAIGLIVLVCALAVSTRMRHPSAGYEALAQLTVALEDSDGAGGEGTGVLLGGVNPVNYQPEIYALTAAHVVEGQAAMILTT